MNIKAESLPEGLEEFILTNFETLTQVEVLCYFYKHSSSLLTPQSVCHVLFLSETLTNKTLVRLHGKGFISQEGAFYKLSEHPAVDSGHLQTLSKLFETRKPLIIEILFNTFMKDAE